MTRVGRGDFTPGPSERKSCQIKWSLKKCIKSRPLNAQTKKHKKQGFNGDQQRQEWERESKFGLI